MVYQLLIWGAARIRPCVLVSSYWFRGTDENWRAPGGFFQSATKYSSLQSVQNQRPCCTSHILASTECSDASYGFQLHIKGCHCPGSTILITDFLDTRPETTALGQLWRAELEGNDYRLGMKLSNKFHFHLFVLSMSLSSGVSFQSWQQLPTWQPPLTSVLDFGV